MRINRRRETNKSETVQVYSVPAPYGGINSNNSSNAMEPQDALYAINMFPLESSMIARKGCTFHNDTGTAPKSFATYYGDTTKKLFSSGTGGILDITVGGTATQQTIAASAITTTGLWQYCQMGTIGGKFLMLFDGANDAVYFDGTNWSYTSFGGGATQISGVNPNVIVNCNIYKNRLYLIEKNSANVWYMPLNAIYGAATKLDLSSLLIKGATIISMVTWSVESSGLQEYACFFSDQGEVIVYTGSDPSVATDFKIAFRAMLGKPLGYRCFEKVGGDIFILNEDGVIPLSKVLASDRLNQNVQVSYKLRYLLQKNYTSSAMANKYTAQIILCPPENQLSIYFNTNGSFVMNTNTGAWTQFNGWYGVAVYFDGIMYSGTNTSQKRVCKLNTGTSDDGTAIQYYCKQTFNYLGTTRGKQITAVRPIFNVPDFYGRLPRVYVTFDYKAYNANTEFLETIPYDAAKTWVSASTYRGAISTIKSANGFGITVSLTIYFNQPVACNGRFEWNGTDVFFKLGGYL